MPRKSQSQPKTADSFGGAAPNPPKGEMCMGKDIRISARVTDKEKQKITAKAKKCGISTTEYVRQRALGYEPKTVPPDALFVLLEKIGSLEDKSTSSKLNNQIYNLLKEISETLLLPGKERDEIWLSPDSGRSTET